MSDFSTLNRTIATSATAVTPNDSTDLAVPALLGLYVTVTGAVSFHDMNGATVTLAAVPAFTRIPIAAKRVLTATVATVLALR